MAFPVVPAEQLVGAPELDPELAFLLDEANIDENAVNILFKNQLVTSRDFSNVEQELPQVRAILGEMFGIKRDRATIRDHSRFSGRQHETECQREKVCQNPFSAP